MRLIPYFGGKTRLAKSYSPPRYNRLVEPFAGGAAYALRYPGCRVELYDINPVIAGVWDWIIHATPRDIDQIPDDPPRDVRLLRVPQELRWLLGFWANPGSVAPCNIVTQYGKASWHLIKPRLLGTCPRIRHWTISERSYEGIDTAQGATWFVDPPYRGAGHHYKAPPIDYDHLGRWCQSLPGQSIVCEADDADWLPFQHHRIGLGGSGNGAGGTKRQNLELVWENCPPQLDLL